MEATPLRLPRAVRARRSRVRLPSPPGRRRRPTGQAAPAAQHPVHRCLVGGGAAVLVVPAKVAFGPARRSLRMAVTVWDDAVVRRLAGLRLPGQTSLTEAERDGASFEPAAGAPHWNSPTGQVVFEDSSGVSPELTHDPRVVDVGAYRLTLKVRTGRTYGHRTAGG